MFIANSLLLDHKLIQQLLEDINFFKKYTHLKVGTEKTMEQMIVVNNNTK